MSFDWDLIEKRPYYSKFAFAYDKLIVRPIKERSLYIRQKLCEHNIPTGRKVLDIGCGPGRYSIELSRLGCKITGIDLSSEQIEQAKINAENEKQQIDLSAVNFLDYEPPELFDAAICRGVLNDITDDSTRDLFFEKVSKVLKSGGLFFFDVRDWQKSKEQYQNNPESVKKVEIGDRNIQINARIKLIEAEQSYIIDETYELIEADRTEIEKYQYKMKCWTIDEVKMRLNRFGFELLSVKGDYNDSVKIGESVYLVVMAKKI